MMARTSLHSSMAVFTCSTDDWSCHRLGMEYIKSVTFPIKQVAPRETLRGLWEDYGHLTEDVVLLEGEVHYQRKPVRSSSSVCNQFL